MFTVCNDVDHERNMQSIQCTFIHHYCVVFLTLLTRQIHPSEKLHREQQAVVL